MSEEFVRVVIEIHRDGMPPESVAFNTLAVGESDFLALGEGMGDAITGLISKFNGANFYDVGQVEFWRGFIGHLKECSLAGEWAEKILAWINWYELNHPTKSIEEFHKFMESRVVDNVE